GRNLARELVAKSRVEVAVGMRYQLEIDAARVFLRGFFRSLLAARPGQTQSRGAGVARDRPGDVESALHRARQELSQVSPDLLTWLAPVVYRSRDIEPIFKGLAETVAERRPDARQVKFTVIVRDEKNVSAYAEMPEFPKVEKTCEVGEAILRDAVDVME